MVFKVRNNYKWVIIIILICIIYFTFKYTVKEGHQVNNEWHIDTVSQNDADQSDIEHSHPHHWATNQYNTGTPISETPDSDNFLSQAQEDGYNCYLETTDDIVTDCQVAPGLTECQPTFETSDPTDSETTDSETTDSDPTSSGYTSLNSSYDKSLFDLFNNNSNFPSDRLVPILDNDTPRQIIHNDKFVQLDSAEYLTDRLVLPDFMFNLTGDPTSDPTDSDPDSSYYLGSNAQKSNGIVFGPTKGIISPINAITLTCGEDTTMAPIQFTLYGSAQYKGNEGSLNTASIWKPIAYVTEINFTNPYQTNLYIFANRKVYTSFKIIFEADTDKIKLTEIQLFLDKESGRNDVFPTCNQ